MRFKTITLASILVSVALWTLAACNKKLTVDAGGPSEASAQKATPQAILYAFQPPTSNVVLSPVALELLRSFNNDLGHDLLVVPALISASKSTITWSDAPARLDTDGCTGVPQLGNSTPAMGLVMGTKFAETYVPNLGHLRSTPLYAAFARCVGLGMGVPGSENSGDVMGPDPTASKNYPAFYTLVTQLTVSQQRALQLPTGD